MGGLGNGRRGGRSPPLMIGALVACILVLGFNYWVSSSRNLDLQTKLYELEGKVRRGVAEMGVVEIKKNEYQEEIQKQKEQIDNMENLLKTQLEQAQNTCSHQKATLQQNISSSTKTIQGLKVQLNQLNDDLQKLQNKLQSCQSNINTLNNKLTYDMTNCNSQLLSQKELCDERVASAKLQVQKKMEKYVASQNVLSKQENAVGGAIKENENTIAGADATAVSPTQKLTQAKGNETPKELIKNAIVGKDEPVELPSSKDITKLEPQPLTTDAAVKQGSVLPLEGAVKTHHDEAETSKLTKNNPSEDKGVELMDTHEQGAQTEDTGMEDMLIGEGKADKAENGQKMEDALEYDADDQAVGGEDLEKQQQRKQAENLDREMEDELADYNGDNENEGEFEADKQAELAQI